MTDTILTGIKNTGKLHIGSYLGAIKPMIELQKSKILNSEDYVMNMFIPDLHSLTVPTDYSKLSEFTIENIKLYIACGLITGGNTYIYRQSRISAHSELAWLLDCFTGFGELSRQTQFKDAHQKGEDTTVGLFNYPVLMAADILLYNAKFVPVGDDQRQHLELARDLAIRINNKFGDVFTVPESMKAQTVFAGQEKPLRIMSLSDPRSKMSKSVSDPRGTIDLMSTPDSARKKIMSAETDSLGSINYDKEHQLGISNLLEIYANFKGVSVSQAEAEFKALDKYGELKGAVADQVCAFLEQIQSKLSSITDERVYEILESGEKAVEPIAQATLSRLQSAVGLG